MLIAIVYERVDKRGHKGYVVKWRYLGEEKAYCIMARGPRWTHKEIAILVENRHDLAKAAKILGRTEEACRRQLYRLGLSLEVTKGKNSGTVVVVFPQPQIDRRKEVIKQSLPGLKKLLEKIDRAEDLAPETVNDLAKIVRAMAALFNAIEKWETGEELLEIFRGGGEAADSEESGE